MKISTFSFYCEVYGMAKVEGFAALPTLQHVEDWLCPEGNGHDAWSQMRSLETIFAAWHNGRGPDSSLNLKVVDIHLF